uniref:hypothetical protein n=1 Tax=Streptomyces calvus TaxID=67282 RepID=UPI003518BB15
MTARGHQPERGARPLRRTIRNELDIRIACLGPGGATATGSGRARRLPGPRRPRGHR